MRIRIPNEVVTILCTLIVVASIFLVSYLGGGITGAVVTSAPGNLTCSFVSAVTCSSGTKLFAMTNGTNAHAELDNESTYGVSVCCSDNSGSNVINTSSNGTAVMNLSNFTNAHAELSNETNFNNTVYISASNANISCRVNATGNGNCQANEACLVTLTNNSNAHVANCSVGAAYNVTVCCSLGSFVTRYYKPYLGTANGLSANGSINGSLTNYTETSYVTQGITYLNLTSGQRFLQFSGLFNQSDVDARTLTISFNESAVVANTTGVTGRQINHSIYLARTGLSNVGVRVCGAATTLLEVNDTCTSKTEFTGPFPQSSNNLTVRLDGNDYRVENITGSGAQLLIVYNSTVIGSNLTNTTVINSTIIISNATNSSIGNSTVDGSNVTNSTLTNTTVNGSSVSNSIKLNSTIITSMVNLSTNLNCVITNVTETNVSCTNATLGNVTLANSTLIGSTIYNGSIANSSLTNSTLVRTNSTNSTITNVSANGSSITNSTKINSTIVNSTVLFGTNLNCSIINVSESNVSCTNVHVENSTIANSTITDMNVTNASIANNVCSRGVIMYKGLTYICPISLADILIECGDTAKTCAGAETCSSCPTDCGVCTTGGGSGGAGGGVGIATVGVGTKTAAKKGVTTAKTGADTTVSQSKGSGKSGVSVSVEAPVFNQLLSKCGNKHCDVGETVENCPIDCAKIPWTKKVCTALHMAIFLLVLVVALLVCGYLFVKYVVKKVQKGVKFALWSFAGLLGVGLGVEFATCTYELTVPFGIWVAIVIFLVFDEYVPFLTGQKSRSLLVNESRAKVMSKRGTRDEESKDSRKEKQMRVKRPIVNKEALWIELLGKLPPDVAANIARKYGLQVKKPNMKKQKEEVLPVLKTEPSFDFANVADEAVLAQLPKEVASSIEKIVQKNQRVLGEPVKELQASAKREEDVPNLENVSTQEILKTLPQEVARVVQKKVGTRQPEKKEEVLQVVKVEKAFDFANVADEDILAQLPNEVARTVEEKLEEKSAAKTAPLDLKVVRSESEITHDVALNALPEEVREKIAMKYQKKKKLLKKASNPVHQSRKK